MKQFSFLLLILLTSKVLGDDCASRYLSLKAPKMPASVAAQHALIKYGPCDVNVAYTLSEFGVASVTETTVTKDRCKAFVSSAITAVENSKFTEGKGLDGCTINFKMDVDIEE